MTAVLRIDDGATIALEVTRWRNDPSPEEHALLASIADPVIDVGCGPGRIVGALAATGRPALGIDSSEHAVAEAASRGAPVLCRSVFGPLPGEGRWQTALLLDGNVGIGGDPATLLVRVRELISPAGEAVVEVERPGTVTGPVVARVETGDALGPWFPWARVGAEELLNLAKAAGFGAVSVERHRDRWFGRLRRR